MSSFLSKLLSPFKKIFRKKGSTEQEMEKQKQVKPQKKKIWERIRQGIKRPIKQRIEPISQRMGKLRPIKQKMGKLKPTRQKLKLIKQKMEKWKPIGQGMGKLKSIKQILEPKKGIILLLVVLLIIGFAIINLLPGIAGEYIKAIRSFTLVNPQIGDFFKKIIETGKNIVKVHQEYMQCLMDPWKCPRINPYKNIKAREAKEVIEKQYGVHVLQQRILDGYTNPSLLYYNCTNRGCFLDSKNSLFLQPPYIFTYLKLSFLEPKDVKINVSLEYVEAVEEIKKLSPCEYYPILSSNNSILFEEILQNVKETIHPIYISLDFKDFNFYQTAACSKNGITGYFKGDNENIVTQFEGAVNDIVMEISYNYSTITTTYILLVRSEACVAAELEGKTIFDYLKIDPNKYLESTWMGDRGIYAAASSPLLELGNYICINMKEVRRKKYYPIYLYVVFRKIDKNSYIKSIDPSFQISPYPSGKYKLLDNIDPEELNKNGYINGLLILNYSSDDLLNLFEGRDFVEIEISITTKGNIFYRFNLGRLKIFNQESS